MKKLFKFNMYPVWLTLSVSVVAGFALWRVSESRWLSTPDKDFVTRNLAKLEYIWYDFKISHRPKQKAQRVVVAKIDDLALKRYGRWPWPRAVYSEILDRLYSLGAEVVAFDAVFSEPEFSEEFVKNTLSTTLPGSNKNLKNEIELQEQQVESLSKLLPFVGDQIFATAINRHPRTILGYLWLNEEDCPLYDPDNNEHRKQFPALLTRSEAKRNGRLHVENFIDDLGTLLNQTVQVKGAAPLNSKNAPSIALRTCLVANRSAISAASLHKGHMNAAMSLDGLYRSSLLFVGHKSEFVPPDHRDFLPPDWFEFASFYPSLSLKAVSLYLNAPQIEVHGENEKGNFKLKSFSLRNDDDEEKLQLNLFEDGSIPINFYGSQASSESDKSIVDFSLGDIEQVLGEAFHKPHALDPTQPLKGQIVFIGATALGAHDLRPTPVQADAAGVYIHAATAARMLDEALNPPNQGSFFKSAPLWLCLAMLFVGAITIFLLIILNASLLSLGATLLFLVTILAIDYFLFTIYLWIFPFVTLFVAMSGLALLLFSWKYFFEEKTRIFLKGAFEKYLPRQVVEDFLANPEHLHLGTRQEVLTVMFCDLRDFTAASENLEASVLSVFLNEYLSAMTEVIVKHEGTIDKYMGDAIMAIFGTNGSQENHAAHAVAAALGMTTALKGLQEKWQQRGFPDLNIGIGINSGEMSIGNMGSKELFSYTVTGDAVNLASRIEKLNKNYHTRIAISQSTREKLGDDFIVRRLDRVQLPGREQSLELFEVLGRGEDPELKQKAEVFERALNLYYATDFLGAKAKFDEFNDDPVATTFSRRCELWLKNPPPPSWDGTWTISSK